MKTNDLTEGFLRGADGTGLVFCGDTDHVTACHTGVAAGEGALLQYNDSVQAILHGGDCRCKTGSTGPDDHHIGVFYDFTHGLPPMVFIARYTGHMQFGRFPARALHPGIPDSQYRHPNHPQLTVLR